MTRPITQSNIMFSKVFASKGNEDILKGLLKDTLGLEIESLEIESPYNIEDFLRKSTNVLLYTEVDVAARLEDGRAVSVEIQLQPHAFFFERALYYLCSRFIQGYAKEDIFEQSAIERRSKYSSLKETHELCILGFTYFADDDDVIHRFGMYDKEHESEASKGSEVSLLNLAFLELTKKRKDVTNVKHWLDYFSNGKVSDDAPSYILKAQGIADKSSITQKEAEVLTREEYAQATNDAILYTKWHEGQIAGMEQGLEQGSNNKAVEVAKAALAKGIDLETIQDITGLDEETIRQL